MTLSDTGLKAALADLADRVPPSVTPWADHERRIAVRVRNRRRALAVGVAGACVLLILGIAVPILATRDHSPVASPAGSGTVGPVAVERYTMNGIPKVLSFTVTRTRDGHGIVTDSVCRTITTVSAGGIERERDELPCIRIGVLTEGSARIHPMATGSCVGGRYEIPSDCVGLRPRIVVIATEPEVARLDVRPVAGRTVAARELGRTGRLALFAADLRNAYPARSGNQLAAFSYAARDANGDVIDQVTLDGQAVHNWPLLSDRTDPTVGPVQVADFINGSAETVTVFVERSRESSGTVRDKVCEGRTRKDETGRVLHRGDGPCSSTTVGAVGPAAIHPVAMGICASGRFGVTADCHVVTGVVVVATAPQVDTLEVTAIGGRSVSARPLGHSDQVALFVADFMRTPVPQDFHQQRFTHTARDANGRVIDEVTLSGLDVADWG